MFLVHLSLKYRHRQRSCTLARSRGRGGKPVLIAGDFNTFWGDHEIYLFMKAAKLRSANARACRLTRAARRAKSSTSCCTATAST